MEIYREEPETISFKVPPGTTEASYDIYRYGESVGAFKTVTATAGEELAFIDVDIPYNAIRFDGSLVVAITSQSGSNNYMRRYTLDVVTPLLPLEEFLEIIGAGATPKKARELERAVRVIVEAYTGQKFGLSRSIDKVSGRGDESLQLPKKLIAYKSISISGVPIQSIRFAVSDDGWFLNSISPEWLEIKEAPPEDLWPVMVNGPIRVPAWYKSKFSDGQVYSIDGLWGWEEVPMDISEAARLLAADYMCNQAAYRDRYLDIIKSSDWTMQYNERAWSGTGNARADLILNDYKRPFVVIV